MITEYKSALYRISYQGVSMIENALGNPNLIQISVVLGCSIIVSPQQGGGIQYLPNGESRKWFLYGVNTKLNKTGHHFIYARLNRDGDQAYLIFSVNDYAIDGTINGENPSPAYYYVKVGEITETDALEGATKQRKITFDYGKYQTDETREGNFWQLRADSQGNEYIITKYPVLSQGAFTQYATLDPVVPSIFEGIPYDNQTIWFNPATQRVEVIGGTGGGEAGSVKWVNITGKPTWIGDTKPTYNWSEIQGEKPFYTKEEIASKFVTIDTEQEITALKHFTAGLSVGESKKKIYEENGVVYIDADVAVTGAMTFYASAGRSVSTIMDAVAVDGITIKKENNVLKAIAGAGSSFDENAMWSALSGSSDNQINKSHLTTALDGYATQNWVIENYATKSELSDVSNKLSDFLEGSDTDNIINKWKELEAFLSGMAETDNLAEILETKADKKYVDSTFVTLATKQTITGEKTFSSVLNTAAIKASGAITAPSLAASDWVTIAGIKLRKLEDGALMLEGNLALTGALTMYATGAQGFDTIYDGLPIDNDTIYWSEVEGSKVLKAKEGSGSSFDKSAMWAALEGATTEQINKTHLTTALNGYATESWVTSKNYLTSVSIATISDLHANWDALLKAAPSAYVTRWPTISEVTDRKNLIIKLNGGSTEGTNLFTYNVTGEKTINITPAGIGAAASSHNHSWSNITSGKPSTLSGYGITDAYTKTESDSKYPTKTGSGASGTWGINVTGNAGTATKLQTARSLWGNNFDGTANISGDITLAIGKGIYLSANDERWLLQTKRSDNTQINGIKTNGFQMCTYFGDTETMRFSNDRIYSYVDFRAEKDLYINGIRLHKTADGVITLEGNLAVTGGVTMYAVDPVSASTIMDGVVVDGVTIKKENGKLVAVGGGEAGSVAWENISGKPSVFATNIANITDLHSSWDSVLAAQKPAWLTAVSIATISDLHANWDALLKAAPSAYVTRWPTISEVTGKQNLIVKLNGGTTEGTNQFTYNATGAKTINITPAGIGTYTKSESDSKYPTKTGSGASGTWGIGITGNAATASKWATARTITLGSYLSGSVSLDGSVNVTLNANVLGLTSQGNKTAISGTTMPAAGVRLYQVYNNGYPVSFGNLLSVKGGGCGELLLAWKNTNRIYYRSRSDVHTETWQSWSTVAFLTDNVASATKLQTARTLWGRSFDGTADVGGDMTGVGWINGGLRVDYGDDLVGLRWRGVHTVEFGGNTGNAHTSYCFRPSYSSSGPTETYLVIQNASASNSPTFTTTHAFNANGIGYHSKGLGVAREASGSGIYTNTIYASDWFRSEGDSGWYSQTYGGGWYMRDTTWIRTYNNKGVLAIRFDADSGLAGSSWNNGDGAFTVRIHDNNNQTPLLLAYRYGTADTGANRLFALELLNTGGQINFSMAGSTRMSINKDTNTATFSGNILAVGGITQYSDQRAKTIIEQITLPLKDIANSPAVRFKWNYWKQKDDGKTHIGGIAQYVQRILPEAIYNSDGALTMDYATTGYIFAVNTAKHLLNFETKTDKEIKKLKQQVKYLEKQLKKLGYEEVHTLDDQSV